MAKRNYELMFILSPELTEEETDALLNRIRGYLAEAEGDILNSEKWGTRRLAYQIEGHKEGEYYLLHFAMEPRKIAGFERSLLLAEGILRELVTRLDIMPQSAQPQEASPEAEESAPAAEAEEATDENVASTSTEETE